MGEKRGRSCPARICSSSGPEEEEVDSSPWGLPALRRDLTEKGDGHCPIHRYGLAGEGEERGKGKGATRRAWPLHPSTASAGHPKRKKKRGRRDDRGGAWLARTKERKKRRPCPPFPSFLHRLARGKKRQGAQVAASSWNAVGLERGQDTSTPISNLTPCGSVGKKKEKGAPRHDPSLYFAYHDKKRKGKEECAASHPDRPCRR